MGGGGGGAGGGGGGVDKRLADVCNAGRLASYEYVKGLTASKMR